MEVIIAPWHLVETLLGRVSLASSDMLLKTCPFGHVLECRGIASVMPLIIDGIEASLDFHIFDVLDLDLLLGSLLKKFFDISLGSLDVKLKEVTSAIATPCLGHPMAKPLPQQNPLEKATHISLFTSPEFVLIEGVEFSTPHENDSKDHLHLCEDERSSLLSTEFQPLPAGPCISCCFRP
jgi:hypothetical protein